MIICSSRGDLNKKTILYMQQPVCLVSLGSLALDRHRPGGGTLCTRHWLKGILLVSASIIFSNISTLSAGPDRNWQVETFSCTLISFFISQAAGVNWLWSRRVHRSQLLHSTVVQQLWISAWSALLTLSKFCCFDFRATDGDYIKSIFKVNTSRRAESLWCWLYCGCWWFHQMSDSI